MSLNWAFSAFSQLTEDICMLLRPKVRTALETFNTIREETLIPAGEFGYSDVQK